MMFINVDLPEPLAPMMATNSPDSTRNDTPRKASTLTSPVSYTLTMLSSSIGLAKTLSKQARSTLNVLGKLKLRRLIEQARLLPRRCGDDRFGVRVAILGIELAFQLRIPLDDFLELAVGDA